MIHVIAKRSIALLLTLVFLLSCFPASAVAREGEMVASTSETRAVVQSDLGQKAADLKAQIQGLPATGGEQNARVDLTGFAPTTDEGDPIYGLRGQYYVAYLQDDATAMVLDGSWADDSKVYKATENEYFAPLPSISVPISGDSLDTTSLDEDIAFTLLPADIFKKIGRHVFAFANTTLSGSAKEIYQLGIGSGSKVDVTVRAYNAISSSPRILTQRIAGSNEMELFYSTSGGDLFTLKTANTDATPSFGWVKATTGTTGTPFVLYHRWSTVGLRVAIENALPLLNNPDSYVAAEYANFLTCLEKGIATFNIYNGFSGIIAPYVYPQEEMDRLALELESYHTLLTKKNYIDIPVEIIDFRSDGYLFENTGNYSFRVDINDAALFDEAAAKYAEGSDNYIKAKAVADGIRKKFTGFPELPGQVVEPVNIAGEVSNMRTGLTEKSLVNGKLVYDPQTITFMAHLMCKKESNTSTTVSYFVPGLAKALHEYIHDSFYLPYNKSGVTEEEQNIVMGSWEQTLAKIGGTNGNPITWSQVETAHDAAYYLLTYLWQPVPETDTFYNSADPNTADPSLVSQADNRYNKIVTERDTLRLYGDAKGVYTLNSWQEMGYSGRYAFNTDLTQSSGIKPKFAPIDGLGFEEPGVMENLFDTDPASGRVVVEGYNGYDANYNLSMHAYGSFVYYEDQKLYFEFDGDDDVYFFIGGDLALDIGSSHSNKKGRCNLNDFTFQNGSKLKNGETYTFDMFYTERATPDANLKFTTNINIVDEKALTTKGQYLVQHGMESYVDSKTGFGIEREENAILAIGDTVAYSFELLNTRTVPLTNVSFTDDTLGVSISEDNLKLCDPENNYALSNGAKTEITDIVVAYRTYDATAGVNGDPLTMVSYDTMVPRIIDATTVPTGEIVQFTQLDPGSYGVRISSEEDLKTLLKLGIPVNCQMIVYGFKRIMVTEDRPYKNYLESRAYYKRVEVEGTGLVYGDPIPVSGAAYRTLRVPDVNSIAKPTAEAERYVIDYNKPVEMPIKDLTKHVYGNNQVAVGKLVGFVPTGSNGDVLRRLPDTLYCESESGGKTFKTAYGTVSRSGDKLTYSLEGFLPEIDCFYAVVEVTGYYVKSESDQIEYHYPYILVEIQVIPASIMYYETELAAKEFEFGDSSSFLYFDFKNTPADQKRYNSVIYNHANFDSISPIRWVTNMQSVEMDNKNEGTLTINGKYISSPTATKGAFVDTASMCNGRDFALHYNLTGNDVFQIRFKMENYTSPNNNPYVSLHPAFDGKNSVEDETKIRDWFDVKYLTNGEYYVASLPLTEASYKHTYLSSLRAYFGSVNCPSEDVSGKIIIDYIYIGPADKKPVGEHLYFGFTDRGADWDRYNTPLYGNGNFYNYDTGTWQHRTSTLQSISFDATEEGKFVLTTKDNNTLHSKDANGNPLYNKDGTLANLGNEAWIQASFKPKTGLNMNYHPKEGDVLLLRFRMVNIKKADGKTLGVRFAFHTAREEVANVSPLYSFNTEACPAGATGGEYVEMRIGLWDKATYQRELLTSFRLTFTGLALKDPGLESGKIEIDYIYIGREADFPHMDRLYNRVWQTVTDGTSHTGETQETDFVNRTVYDLNTCADSERFYLGFDDTENGFKVIEAKAIGDTDFPSVHMDLTGLTFNPAKAEVYQVRFKLENFAQGKYINNGKEITHAQPYVDLHYKPNDETAFGENKIAGNSWLKYYGAEYRTNGEFITMTLDLTENFCKASKINTLRFYFGGIEAPADGTNGILSIDYIYIGPRDRTPADTVYGYDPSYNDDSMLSNGSSFYVEGAGVRLNGKESNYTESYFSFTGTGFDIISRTGIQQATIRVSVFNNPERTGTPVKALTVNNKGELELNQIPVVSIQGLTHGTYYVTIGVNKEVTGSAYEFLNRGNQFYFDAIRIYNHIDDTKDTKVNTVYKLDKEANAFIKEVRNILLTSQEFKDLLGTQEGAVFIDTFRKETVMVPDPETGELEEVSDPEISIDDHFALTVQTYNKIGPKNEVYLSPGQAVAFRLTVRNKVLPASLDIGAKTITGKPTRLVAGIVTGTDNMEAVLSVATKTDIGNLSSATAMYYPLEVSSTLIPSAGNNVTNTSCYIVLYNGTETTDTDRDGDYVISITDIKAAYEGVYSGLPEDSIDDPEIMKRNSEASEPVSFLVDEHTALAAAVFLRKELSLPLEDSDTKLLHSLDLASSIALNYAVAKTELADCTDVYLEVRIPKYSGNTLVGTEVRKLQPVEKEYYYYFTLADLTAVAMNDVMEATLFYTRDGQTYVTEKDTYSISQYAYGQLGKEGVNETLKTLCADLLRYGSAAQTFKSYRLDSLADGTMTEDQKAYLSDIEAVTFGNTNKVLSDLSNAPIIWAGKTMNLASKVSIKFVFRPESYNGNLSDLTLRISYEDVIGITKTHIVRDPELYDEAMGAYVFTVDTLLAAELRSVVSAQIYAGDTPVSCTLQYSADTYGNNKTGALLELCKALFAYSDSAKAYFFQG